MAHLANFSSSSKSSPPSRRTRLPRFGLCNRKPPVKPGRIRTQRLELCRSDLGFASLGGFLGRWTQWTHVTPWENPKVDLYETHSRAVETLNRSISPEQYSWRPLLVFHWRLTQLFNVTVVEPRSLLKVSNSDSAAMVVSSRAWWFQAGLSK